MGHMLTNSDRARSFATGLLSTCLIAILGVGFASAHEPAKTEVTALGLDELGNIVARDWVFIIKTYNGTKDENCTKTAASVYNCVYLYADSENPSFRMIGSVAKKTGIFDGGLTQNPVTAVLELIQENGNGVVMWNDQGPCGTHTSSKSAEACSGFAGDNPYPHGSAGGDGWETAHSKGLLGIGRNGGVFINHSNPHWPLTHSNGEMEIGKKTDHSGLSSAVSQHFLMISLDAQTLDGFARLLQTIAPSIQVMEPPSPFPKNSYPLLTKFFEGLDPKHPEKSGWSTDLERTFGMAGKSNTMKSQEVLKKSNTAWSVGSPNNPPEVAAVVRYDFHSSGPKKTAFSTYAKSPMYQFDWVEHVIAPDLQADMLVYSFHPSQSPPFLVGQKPPQSLDDMHQYKQAFVPYAANFFPYGYDAARRGFAYNVRNIGFASTKSGTPQDAELNPLSPSLTCPSVGDLSEIESWRSNHMKVGIAQRFNDSLRNPVPGQDPLNDSGSFRPYVIAGGWNRAGGQWKRGSLFTAFESKGLWESLWCLFSFNPKMQWCDKPTTWPNGHCPVQ